MRVLKMRLFHVKIYKIFIYIIIAVFVKWNVSYIFESKFSIPLKHLQDDKCNMDAIESGWYLNPYGHLHLEPIDTRIFFHATSCKHGLTSRQACSVESTATANPDWNIQVIFIGHIDKFFMEGRLFKYLQTLENVDFFAIDLIKYMQGTPLEILDLKNIVFMTEKHNLADLLKYITLYKFGGVYMDMDFIVKNSFNDLGKNWAGKPIDDELGTDVLSFSNDILGRTIANATILEIARQLNPLSGDRGLNALTQALEKICSTNNIANMSAENCWGFKFYGQRDFYPVPYEDIGAFFIPEDNSIYTAAESTKVHAHRMWTEITGTSKFPNNSLIIKLASSYCPNVFSLYGDDFGI